MTRRTTNAWTRLARQAHGLCAECRGALTERDVEAGYALCAECAGPETRPYAEDERGEVGDYR